MATVMIRRLISGSANPPVSARAAGGRNAADIEPLFLARSGAKLYKKSMRNPGTGRKSVHTRLRRAYALIAFVWANLAMLPCAMAVGDGAPMHDSGHEAAAGHHAHHGGSDDSDGAGADGDCCDLGDASVHERPSSSKINLGGELPAIVFHDLELRVDSSAHRLHTTTDPPVRRSGAPRLHVLHCVFLD